MAGAIFGGSIRDATQASGAQTLALEESDKFRLHQIQVEVSEAPSAGELDVSIKTPGASGFQSIGTIDLTDPAEYVQQFRGYASEIRVTPSGFDAGKTYSVFVASGAA